MASVGPLLIGVVFLVIAGLVGRYGRKHHRRQARVIGTETTTIREINDDGSIELKGEVVPEETLQSPFQGKEAVLSGWEIEEWDERGDSESWDTLTAGVYAKPFILNDGTGEVRVDVGDHIMDTGSGLTVTDVNLGPLNFDQWLSNGVSVDNVFCSFDRFAPVTTVPPDADPPERIAEFIEGEASVSPQTDSITNIVDFGTKHGERRYYEGVIDPGEEVYLLGEAEAKAEATYPLGPEDVVITPPGDGDSGTMIVSNQSEEALVSQLGRYKWAYAAAAGIALVGVGLLLYGAGVVPV